jgi:hypothetical protein
MDILVQLVAALGGWGAAVMTYVTIRSKWMHENARLEAEVSRLRAKVDELEPELAETRADLRHQLEQARLSIEIEHALAEEVGSFGGGAPSTALTRARRQAEEALDKKILRDRRVTTRAAIEGRLARFELDPTDREGRSLAVQASTAA